MDDVAEYPQAASPELGRDPDPVLAEWVTTFDRWPQPRRDGSYRDHPSWDAYYIAIDLARHCLRSRQSPAAVVKLLGSLGARVPGWPTSAQIVQIVNREDKHG